MNEKDATGKEVPPSCSYSISTTTSTTTSTLLSWWGDILSVSILIPTRPNVHSFLLLYWLYCYFHCLCCSPSTTVVVVTEDTHTGHGERERWRREDVCWHVLFSSPLVRLSETPFLGHWVEERETGWWYSHSREVKIHGGESGWVERDTDIDCRYPTVVSLSPFLLHTALRGQVYHWM